MRTPVVSIVGGETPLGREVRERLADTGVQATIQMLGASDQTGAVLTEGGDEATLLTPIDSERILGSDVVCCAGTFASTRKAYNTVKDAPAPPPFVDLTHALEDMPGARLRSPFHPVEQATTGAIHAIAHPAAAALALLLTRIQTAFPLRHSVVLVFEPVSERGQGGMNELQQQVAGLFAFRTLPKQVFDAQAAFTMLPSFGEEAPEGLGDIQLRLERHLASLLAGRAPLPSLRLIQAPVFHGHSFSVWLDFEQRPSVTELSEAVATPDIEVRGADVEAPNNVGVAGQSGVSVGMVTADENNPRGMWLWAAADNYRVMGDGAAAVVRAILAGERAG